LEQRKQKV
jgi:hypothetical protein